MRSMSTYDAGKAESEREFGCDRVHPIEHVYLAGLVRVLQVAVIEVLLEVNDDLTIITILHHEDAGENAVPRQWVLALQLHVAVRSCALITGQERRPVLILHLVCTTAHHLDRCRELCGLCIAELPSERCHEVLAEGHGDFKDETIVGSMSFDSHASAADESLERHWVALRSWAVGCQQSLHLFGV